jgi:hypothetical protein
MYDQQLFLVSSGNVRYVTWAIDRESAKRNAFSWVGGNPDKYEVTPLSERGDRVHIALTLAI